MATCSSCAAPIVWALTEANGRRMPLDPLPSPRGNVELLPSESRRVARVLGAEAAAERRAAGHRLWISHYATCPNAAEHRR